MNINKYFHVISINMFPVKLEFIYTYPTWDGLNQ